MSQGRLNVVRAMAAMAWSDGRLDKKEKEKLRLLARRVLSDPQEQAKVEGFLISRPNLEGITFGDLNEKEREALYLLAAHYAYLDGNLRPGERAVLDRLGDLLSVAPTTRAAIEEQARAKHT